MRLSVQKEENYKSKTKDIIHSDQVYDKYLL